MLYTLNFTPICFYDKESLRLRPSTCMFKRRKLSLISLSVSNGCNVFSLHKRDQSFTLICHNLWVNFSASIEGLGKRQTSGVSLTLYEVNK